MLQYETNAHNGRPLLQPHGDEAVYFNPPALPLDEAEMDGLYDLPFARRPHRSYGGERIPAFETVKHSIVTMRGCFGGCTFCSITEHEGRIIQSRSAGQRAARGARALAHGGLRRDDHRRRRPDRQHVQDALQGRAHRERVPAPVVRAPGICENLVTDHGPLIELLKKVREEPGVERVFVASGVRYDLAERSPEFIRELAHHHTGGQLSVAPEHTNPEVLDKMKKPPVEHYERFAQAFCQASEEAGKEQYLVPYFITGHPGSTLKDTVELALWLKARNMRPRQVQDFIPTPMAIATTMFFTGIDPLTMEPVPVVRDLREKKMMKALLYWWDPEQHPLAREALRKAGRRGPHRQRPRSCLVPPRAQEHDAATRSPPAALRMNVACAARGGARVRPLVVRAYDEARARRWPFLSDVLEGALRGVGRGGPRRRRGASVHALVKYDRLLAFARARTTSGGAARRALRAGAGETRPRRRASRASRAPTSGSASRTRCPTGSSSSCAASSAKAALEAALARMNEPPPRVARVNTLHTTREACLAALARRAGGARRRRTRRSGVVLEGRRSPFRTQAFARGDLEMQDEASQLVAELVAPPPRSRSSSTRARAPAARRSRSRRCSGARASSWRSTRRRRSSRSCAAAPGAPARATCRRSRSTCATSRRRADASSRAGRRACSSTRPARASAPSAATPRRAGG